MNYRPIGHMQKQFSSISETVQSSQNSSNNCTVQSLQYRFNTKLISVRQTEHPRPSSRTRSADVEQNRWCPHGTSAIRGLWGAIRHTSQLSLSVSGVSTWLSVWLSMSTTSAWSVSSSSTSLFQQGWKPELTSHGLFSSMSTRGVEILLYLPTVIMDTNSRVNMSNLLFPHYPFPHYHVSHFHFSHFQRPHFNFTIFFNFK